MKMPTEHKKKSTKSEKKLPIPIKCEPEDLKPLENYVDDRVKLIQQIFGTLKSKTIQSIIPDFLQSKSIEELQEVCLEEVLGISRKRLLSVINATKCPSDTDSSDSDVDKVEEHISLEEISSDSNDELIKPKKKKKKDRDANSKKVENSEAAAVLPTSLAPSDKANGRTDGKQYSMLELLELQARARAIRSQLALEPVTKIELDDSDSDTPNISTNNVLTKSGDIPNVTDNGGNHKEIEAAVEKPQTEIIKPSRPIRLKRNFRQRQENHYDDPPHANENENDTLRQPTPPKAVEVTREESKSENESVVPNDDDIIPVVQEQEIFCISSSDSDDEDPQSKLKQPKKTYIQMPVIEKLEHEPTEDELFLQKIKQDAKKIIELPESSTRSGSENIPSEKDVNSVGPVGEEPEDVSIHNLMSKRTINMPSEEEPPEDGEIIEEEEEEEEEVVQIHNDSSDESSHEEPKNDSKLLIEPESKNGNSENTPNRSEVVDESQEKTDIHKVNISSDSSDSDTENVSEKSEHTAKKSNIDDDDEDIIDLGKDEDLDFDVPDEPKVSTRQTRSKKSNEKKVPTTEEKFKDYQSWDKRWLRGSKVTKVLVTSKLASKVRSKIKEKKSMEAKKIEETVPEKPEPPVEILENIEVGSVEHFNELTKQK